MAELADAQDLGSCEVIHVGSTPTTRTTKEPSFVYQDKRGFFMLLGVKNSSKHRQIAIKQGLKQSIGLVSPLLFAFRRLKKQAAFGRSFHSKGIGNQGTGWI